MRTKHTFRKKLIASAVASCTLAGLANIAHGQDDSMIEEVIVTGIRASIERSMDLKRDASGEIDGISAEEIGKVPDAKLAGSLQRSTAVTINRENGKGSKSKGRG